MASVFRLAKAITYSIAKEGGEKLALSFGTKGWTIRQANLPINTAVRISSMQAERLRKRYNLSAKTFLPKKRTTTTPSTARTSAQKGFAQSAYKRATAPATLRQQFRQKATQPGGFGPPDYSKGPKIVGQGPGVEVPKPRIAASGRKQSTIPSSDIKNNPILRPAISKGALATAAAGVGATVAALYALSRKQGTSDTTSASVRSKGASATPSSAPKVPEWKRVIQVYGDVTKGVKSKTDYSPGAKKIAVRMLREAYVRKEGGRKKGEAKAARTSYGVTARPRR